MRSTYFLVLVGAAMLAACSASTEDSASSTSGLSEATTPRAGYTIDSPSVDKKKTYLGARNIARLQRLSALFGPALKIAQRADGIIANSPPNGSIGVDELATLETKYGNTLFPEEKAAIPAIWQLLELPDVEHFNAPEPPTLTVHGQRDVPKPFELPIASLTADLQDVAKRIELTNNSDGDPATISGADVQKANANNGAFLPAEAAQFGSIHQTIASTAPHIAIDVQYVEAEEASRVLFDQASVQLVADFEPQVYMQDRDKIVAEISMQTVTADPSIMFVALDEKTGAESDWRSKNYVNGEIRIEAWKGGVRVAQFNAGPGKTVVWPSFPYGYSAKLGGRTYDLVCPEGHPICLYEPRSNRAPVKTPSGSYFIEGKQDLRLDVFPNGRAELVHPQWTRTCYASTSGSCSIYDPKDPMHIDYTVTFGQTGVTMGSYVDIDRGNVVSGLYAF